MENNADLDFISGDFLIIRKDCLPKDKRFLWNYFGKEKFDKAIVIYYHTFKGLLSLLGPWKFYQLFIDHTGYMFDRDRFSRRLKYIDLFEAMCEVCQKEMDFTLLKIIHKGYFPLDKDKAYSMEWFYENKDKIREKYQYV